MASPGSRGNLMGMDIDVTFEFDPANPPPISDEERVQLAALAAMPDEAIDTSDLPPLTEAFFARAVRNPLYRPG